MDSHIEQALRALYKGDRTEVEELLKGRAKNGQEMWLLAASTEDDVKRHELLKRVVRTREQPYAGLASAILKREQEFTEEMERAPGWQRWLLKYRPFILRFIVTVVVFSGASLVILWIFSPPSEDPEVTRLREAVAATQIAIQATADILALTPTATPTATPLPIASQQSVDYAPLGSLRIISFGYPTTLPIGRNGRVDPPNAQFSYAAIQFEFTCGPGYSNRAFCNNPPEVRDIKIQYNDGRQESFGGHTVIGTDIADRVPVGQSMRGWIAFPVPSGLRPAQLILVVNADAQGQTLREVSVRLP